MFLKTLINIRKTHLVIFLGPEDVLMHVLFVNQNQCGLEK